MRIGYKKVKTLIVDPKKTFLKWASLELKSSLHLTPCPIDGKQFFSCILLHQLYENIMGSAQTRPQETHR